jgi:2'-5' RNA ligase
LFVAAGIDRETRHAIAARLEHVAVPGRVVAPSNWHVTLRFIGEVAPPVVDRVAHAIDESELGSPFRVRWGGLGAFPRSAKATVLWAGPAFGRDDLIQLAVAVGEGLEGAGLPGEERPFRPHLTLSRIRPPLDVTALIASIDPLGVAMTVDRIDLMATRSEDGVTRYDVVESFELS